MGWLETKAMMLDLVERTSQLQKSSGGKTNLSVSNIPSGSNKFSAASYLPDRRHYLSTHSIGQCYMGDFLSMKMAQQNPSLPGASLINGQVPFPDGEVLLVPSNATSITVFDSTTENYRTIATAPGSYAFLGGARIDDEWALLAPHNQNYALKVNKNTGEKIQLTGYNFGGNYACGGVRKCSTGEFYFVPHNHTKHVFWNPDNGIFRELAIPAPGFEAYIDCTNLHTGELYVAMHKASCSVVINPVTGDILNTLPPPNVSSLTPNYANFRTCKWLADGDVILVPFKHNKCWRYDRDTNKHTQIPGTYNQEGVGDVGCASMNEWGDVLLWPWNGSTVYKLSTGYGFTIPPELITSQYINAF